MSIPLWEVIPYVLALARVGYLWLNFQSLPLEHLSSLMDSKCNGHKPVLHCSKARNLNEKSWEIPGTPNNHLKMDVWWFPTISYVKIGNHPIDSQPFINGCLGFQVSRLFVLNFKSNISQYTLACPPSSVTTRIITIFRIRDPNLNLHLPLESWEGDNPKYTKRCNHSPKKISNKNILAT